MASEESELDLTDTSGLAPQFFTRTLKGSGRGPARRTESSKRLSKHKLLLSRQEYDRLYRAFHEENPRPETLGECSEERPCPYVSCKYHLAYDTTPNGNLVHNFPGLEVWELDSTCMFDEIEPGSGSTLEAIGSAMNLTRERVRQIERQAFAKISESLSPEDRSRLREFLGYDPVLPPPKAAAASTLIPPQQLVRRTGPKGRPESVRPAQESEERVVVVRAEPEGEPVVSVPVQESVMSSTPEPESATGPRLVPPPAMFQMRGATVHYGDYAFESLNAADQILALVTAYGTASVLAKMTTVGETTLSGIRRGKTNAGPWVLARLLEAARAKAEARPIQAVPESPLARRNAKPPATPRVNRAKEAPAPVPPPSPAPASARKVPSKAATPRTPQVHVDGKLVTVTATISVKDAQSLYHFAREKGLSQFAMALSDALIER